MFRVFTGPDDLQYPYGNTRVPGMCNDNNGWRQYNQTILNYWRANISTPDLEGFGELMHKVETMDFDGSAELVEHLTWLYQVCVRWGGWVCRAPHRPIAVACGRDRECLSGAGSCGGPGRDELHQRLRCG